MRRKSLNNKKVRILLSISIIAIAVSGLLFWNNFLNFISPENIVQKIADEPISSIDIISTTENETFPAKQSTGDSIDTGRSTAIPENTKINPIAEDSTIQNETETKPEAEALISDTPTLEQDNPIETEIISGNIGVPVRITIPSINLNASIEKVSLAADGSMDVPKQPLNTGWYEIGPRPGETGSAVIAGHVDWYNGATAVFTNLYKLKPGDKISVQDELGAVVSFVVREIRKFDAAADATDVFISNDGRAHLNIITCDGAWDENINQYSQRLIVFADKE